MLGLRGGGVFCCLVFPPFSLVILDLHFSIHTLSLFSYSNWFSWELVGSVFFLFVSLFFLFLIMEVGPST